MFLPIHVSFEDYAFAHCQAVKQNQILWNKMCQNKSKAGVFIWHIQNKQAEMA